MADPLSTLIGLWLLDKATGSVFGEYVKRFWFRYIHTPAATEQAITREQLREAEQHLAEAEAVMLRVGAKARQLADENRALKARVHALEARDMTASRSLKFHLCDLRFENDSHNPALRGLCIGPGKPSPMMAAHTHHCADQQS